MNLDFSVIVTNLGGLFLLLFLGFFSVKRGILPLSATAPFASLLLKLTLPCTFFVTLQQSFSVEFLISGGIIAAIGFLLFGGNLLLSGLLCRLLKVPPQSRGTWCILVSFCNNSFMGFPVVLALLGKEGLALATMINISFCLLIYSTGPFLMGKDTGGGQLPKIKWRTVLVTPINVSMALGLLFFITQLPVPRVIFFPMELLGNVTTPLSMLVTGMLMSQVAPKTIFTDLLVWKATLVRLILFPGLTLLLLRALPLGDSLILQVTLVIFSMPAAAISSTLAESYGGDKALTAKVIFLTSLLCILTIPAFTLLL